MKYLFDEIVQIVRQEYPLATLSFTEHAIVDNNLENEIRATGGKNAEIRFELQEKIIREITSRRPLKNTKYFWGRNNQRLQGENVHANNAFARERMIEVYDL